MLNHIIFILKSAGSVYMQTIVEDILWIRQRLQEIAVAVDYLIPPLSETSIFHGQNILYIADHPEALGELLDAGCYAIGLLHEYNRQEDFGRALYMIEQIREMEFDTFCKAHQRLAGLPWHIADTKHLTIRETTEADVEAFYRIYQDPSITFYTENLFPDIEEEKAYIRDYIQKVYGFYGYGIWTVLLRRTGEVIGRAGINWREGYPHPELGFVIAREHQRKGYGEEVCRKILEFAYCELTVDYVQVLVETDNIASLNLCRKLGFKHQETLSLREKEHNLLIRNNYHK